MVTVAEELGVPDRVAVVEGEGEGVGVGEGKEGGPGDGVAEAPPVGPLLPHTLWVASSAAKGHTIFLTRNPAVSTT